MLQVQHNLIFTFSSLENAVQNTYLICAREMVSLLVFSLDFRSSGTIYHWDSIPGEQLHDREKWTVRLFRLSYEGFSPLSEKLKIYVFVFRTHIEPCSV